MRRRVSLHSYSMALTTNDDFDANRRAAVKPRGQARQKYTRSSQQGLNLCIYNRVRGSGLFS